MSNLTPQQEETINNLLSGVFSKILKIEEKVLFLSDEHDLSISEVHTIEAIGPTDHCTMGELAQRLSVTVATVTVAINKLVEKGYVERERGDNDRRVVEVSLTETGREVFTMHFDFHREMIRSATADLSAEEMSVLAEALARVDAFFSKSLQ